MLAVCLCVCGFLHLSSCMHWLWIWTYSIHSIYPWPVFVTQWLLRKMAWPEAESVCILFFSKLTLIDEALTCQEDEGTVHYTEESEKDKEKENMKKKMDDPRKQTVILTQSKPWYCLWAKTGTLCWEDGFYWMTIHVLGLDLCKLEKMSCKLVKMWNISVYLSRKTGNCFNLSIRA